MADFGQDLRALDRRPYPAYKSLRGRSYPWGPHGCSLVHVQGDPFAAPSRLRLDLDCPWPVWTLASRDSRRAAADFFHRALLKVLGATARHGSRPDRGRPRRGSGKSGLIEIAPVGQEVLERSAVSIEPEGKTTVLLSVGLPAQGRQIRGMEAAKMLTEDLPQLVERCLALSFDDPSSLRAHVNAVEDQVSLRNQLRDHGWIAFLAQGSVLPRRSGVDKQPLPEALAWDVPHAISAELTAEHAGTLRGLALPEGVQLIVGGGYHGKSTVLSVLATSVYDHVPGDGRERCVTVDDAVTIRAEDGRAVRGADLRPFIDNLPVLDEGAAGRSTESFETDNASGSTSQAAAIVEALEAGARVLLVDEDTAATNFMVRDARMRELIPNASEPITPFIDRVRQLYEEQGVSSVLVVGGAGDYLDVADSVLRLRDYRPSVVTAEARQVARRFPLGPAAPRPPSPWHPPEPRIPDPRSIDPRSGRRPERVRSSSTRNLEFGHEEIDLTCLQQLVESGQSRAIGDVLLHFSRGVCDGRATVSELLDWVDSQIETAGFVTLVEPGWGDRSRPRRYEISAALNRLRSLRLIVPPESRR